MRYFLRNYAVGAALDAIIALVGLGLIFLAVR
jgi:hypothetical protein